MLLKFLTETVHPVVRPDSAESQAMVAEYNSLLAVDGWEIYRAKELSAKPVFGYRRLIDGSTTHLEQVKEGAASLSGHYVAQQVRRLQDAVERDPELAIGTAKEFLETLCKTILTERGITVSKNEDLPVLVKAVIKSVKILPAGASAESRSEETVAARVSARATVSLRRTRCNTSRDSRYRWASPRRIAELVRDGARKIDRSRRPAEAACTTCSWGGSNSGDLSIRMP